MGTDSRLVGRLFIVTHHAPKHFSPDTGRMECEDKSLVVAEDIPDAWHRFVQAHPTIGAPKGICEAGPVAQNVLRMLKNSKTLPV